MELDNILRTIGLALRAGRLAVGEDPAGDACYAHDCRLLLTARDAAERTLRRAERFAEAGQCLRIPVPYSREELGQAVGRASCALAAVTDLGFARSIVEKLAAADPERYGDTLERLSVKAQRAARRREEQKARDRERGGRRRSGKK